MRVSELGQRCGYDFFGEDREVRDIRFLSDATEEDLVLILRPGEIEKTKAGTVLSKPQFLKTEKTVLLTHEDPGIAIIRVAEILYEERLQKLRKPISYEQKGAYYCGCNVTIGEGTTVSPGVCIGDDVTIGANCRLEPGVTIGTGCRIGDNVRIGVGSCIGADAFFHSFDGEWREFPGVGDAILEDNVWIGNHVTIQRGTFSDTYLGRGTQIGNLVDVGHDVQIGRDCRIVSQTGIAGYVRLEDGVQIMGQVGISNKVVIGRGAKVLAKSLVTKNVKAGSTVSGMYAREHGEELRRLVKERKGKG